MMMDKSPEIPNHWFVFVQKIQIISYHTLTMTGSEMGCKERALQMAEMGDDALKGMTVKTSEVKVRTAPVREKHLAGRGPRVVVHEDSHVPHRWRWTLEDTGEQHPDRFPTAGTAYDHARAHFGNDSDVWIKSEGYPTDGVDD